MGRSKFKKATSEKFVSFEPLRCSNVSVWVSAFCGVCIVLLCVSEIFHFMGLIEFVDRRAEIWVQQTRAL